MNILERMLSRFIIRVDLHFNTRVQVALIALRYSSRACPTLPSTIKPQQERFMVALIAIVDKIRDTHKS